MDDETNNHDYVWHFKLGEPSQPEPGGDALTEMLRQQLRAMLGCVVLTSAGANLRVSGFRLLSELETEHAIYPEADATAPRPAAGEPACGDAPRRSEGLSPCECSPDR